MTSHDLVMTSHSFLAVRVWIGPFGLRHLSETKNPEKTLEKTSQIVRSVQNTILNAFMHLSGSAGKQESRKSDRRKSD